MRTNYPRHLATFSYVGFQRYFLTFCAFDRRPVFIDAPTIGLIIAQFVRAAADEQFAIIAYCFMSDHVHVVVEGMAENSDLKRFIRRAKQFSGYEFAQLRGQPLWQRYGYERVLRGNESTRAVVKYILENPIRAGITEDVREYPYIGSGIYTRDELIDFAYGEGSG